MCGVLLSANKRYMNYYAGPWDYVENLHSPWRTPRRSLSHTQKQNPNMSWQTPTLSLLVLVGFLCTELATTGSSLSRHVGVLFLSVGWGSAWGSSRRMQVFYVIPGSRVIVHMYYLDLVKDGMLLLLFIYIVDIDSWSTNISIQLIIHYLFSLRLLFNTTLCFSAPQDVLWREMEPDLHNAVTTN